MPTYSLSIFFTVFLILSTSKLIQRREDYIKLSAKKSSNNLYYTQLFIGNPPQMQKLIIDSGSAYPVIRHRDCKLCYQEQLDSVSFNPSQSMTYKPLNCRDSIETECYTFCPYSEKTCNFQMRYGVDDLKSSLSGIIGSDQVRFQLPDSSGEQNTKQVFAPNFGLYTRQSRVMEKVTSGILGINKYQSSSILFKWFQLNNIPRSDRKIGLCFSGNNGYLQFGNIKQQQAKSIRLSQAFYFGGQYSFKVNIMKIKEHQITPNYTFMLDSGSQVMIFPVNFFNQVVQKVKDVCFMNFITCSQMDSTEPIVDFMDMNIDYQAKCYQINNFNIFDIDQYLNYNYPPIQMKIGDRIFKIMPSEYMQKISGSIFYSFICMRIKPSIQQMYLLGIRWMKGKKIVFHLKQEVIEIFQEYNCVNFYQQAQSWAEDITIPQIIATKIVIVLLIWYCLRKKLTKKSQQIELSTF